MKRALITLSIMLLPTMAFAIDKSDVLKCSIPAGAAWDAMMGRQSGDFLLSTRNEESDWVDEKWTDEIVDAYIEAYEQPIYSTDEEWKIAARDLGNKVLLRCLKDRG